MPDFGLNFEAPYFRALWFGWFWSGFWFGNGFCFCGSHNVFWLMNMPGGGANQQKHNLKIMGLSPTLRQTISLLIKFLCILEKCNCIDSHSQDRNQIVVSRAFWKPLFYWRE